MNKLTLCDLVRLIKRDPAGNVQLGKTGRVMFIHDGGDQYSVEFTDGNKHFAGIVTGDRSFFLRLPDQVEAVPVDWIHTQLYARASGSFDFASYVDWLQVHAPLKAKVTSGSLQQDLVFAV